MLHFVEALQAVKKLERSDALVRATPVAQEFGISRVTLWRWERDGLLPPAYRINNRKYYPRTVLDALKHAAAKPGGTRSASASARSFSLCASLAFRAARLRFLSDTSLPLRLNIPYEQRKVDRSASTRCCLSDPSAHYKEDLKKDCSASECSIPRATADPVLLIA